MVGDVCYKTRIFHANWLVVLEVMWENKTILTELLYVIHFFFSLFSACRCFLYVKLRYKRVIVIGTGVTL